mmetsp:Transcript_23350/g.42222  ORF Transcript_23350/g.42222 Transcript_23350/m.42222 type:complete len:181 (+) Transcript_23350:37-579(+)|eukprot:CAMPEP_0197664106 /NCGR_PEP_ID=MMETSP1338-20131121/58436_1 /TAXON_ID=43686 ORGANISM="Pelagodinium beii, Strain RCC1491" /NCGR_SAMPLE_ID=MMETSP1338 /ASSEMBLY_ACC=CAM_ASM_000754 /LENGTH=180 /DNA_ID=CAMNT_0043242677 /DNA_START=37 /DNA_END=579 /DNA_ORIENTATION=-
MAIATPRAQLVPSPPDAPRPQRARPALGATASPPGSGGSVGSGGLNAAPVKSTFSSSGLTPRKLLTPRNLPPLGDVKASAPATPRGGRAISRCSAGSAASTAPPTPDVAVPAEARLQSFGTAGAPQDSEASAAKAAELLTNRKESKQGGRSFFKWSFRGKKTGKAQKKYEVSADGSPNCL